MILYQLLDLGKKRNRRNTKISKQNLKQIKKVCLTKTNARKGDLI